MKGKIRYKMEESYTQPGTTVSVARKRLKMMTCLVLGTLGLSSVGIGGYFAYKTVIDISYINCITIAIHMSFLK